MELIYFTEMHGFTGITINEDRMLVQHFTYGINNATDIAEPELVYEFTRTKF